MKHFIVEIIYTVPFEQVSDTVPLHRTFLQAGYERGWLLCSGPQMPRVGGIVVARAPSLEALQQFFADDPYQQRGQARYRFTEFDPVLRQSFLEEWATQ